VSGSLDGTRLAPIRVVTRRLAHVPGKRGAERARRAVANACGDRVEPEITAAEQILCDGHAPREQVFHRRLGPQNGRNRLIHQNHCCTAEKRRTDQVEEANLAKSLRIGESLRMERDLEKGTPSPEGLDVWTPRLAREEQGADERKDATQQRPDEDEFRHRQTLGFDRPRPTPAQRLSAGACEGHRP